MFYRSKLEACFMALILTGLISCASTQLTGSWKAADYNKPISKILVIGMSKNTMRRRAYEDALVEHFREHGVEAVSSATVIPADKELDKETISKAVKESGFDSVLVTRMVSVDKETTYVRSANYSVPHNYYGNFNNYYYQTYSSVNTQDYLITDTIVSLETNIWETEKGDLVWAITSETFNPTNINKEIKSISDIIVGKLVKDGLVSSN